MLDVYHKRHHTMNIKKKWTCTFPDKIKIHVYWSNNSNNKIMIIIPEQAPSVWSTLGVCPALTINMKLNLQPHIYLWLGSCQSDLLTTWVMTFDQFNDPGRSWMATKQLQTKALGTSVNHLSRLRMDVGGFEILMTWPECLMGYRTWLMFKNIIQLPFRIGNWKHPN